MHMKSKILILLLLTIMPLSAQSIDIQLIKSKCIEHVKAYIKNPETFQFISLKIVETSNVEQIDTVCITFSKDYGIEVRSLNTFKHGLQPCFMENNRINRDAPFFKIKLAIRKTKRYNRLQMTYKSKNEKGLITQYTDPIYTNGLNNEHGIYSSQITPFQRIIKILKIYE